MLCTLQVESFPFALFMYSYLYAVILKQEHMLIKCSHNRVFVGFMCNACGLGRVRLKKMTLSFWYDCQFLF